MKLLAILFFLLMTAVVVAQEVLVNGELTATAIVSNEEAIPFWMYTNTNASIGLETNFSGAGDIKASYAFSNSLLEAGAAFYYRDGVTDEFQRRDLYIKFQNNWLKATAGAKKQDEKLHGLSATNKNFLLSSNARPIPGLLIEANNPLKISNSLGLDWGIAHYSLNDDRIVDNTMVHYKRLGLHWKIKENHILKGTLQHFAQWGGTSPTFGKLNNDFKAFVDVFFARKASEITVEDELLNAVGNHLGSYLLEYETQTSLGDFTFYHEHPFEDGSGTRLANFPDGVWGIYFQPGNKKIVSGVLYEYITTQNQSKGTIAGPDNYFNNGIYTSGWTYEARTIGLPFIISPLNNSVRAHQFGLTGTVKKVDLTLKASIVANNGTKASPYNPKQNAIYTFAKASYSVEHYGQLSLLFGYDYDDTKKDIVGSGLSYTHTF